MSTINGHTWIILAGVACIALVAPLGWSFYQRRRTLRLQKRFGAQEYERTVDKFGSRAKAEGELRGREKRVEGLTIVALTPGETTRFSQAWTVLQGRFIDNPKGIVEQADQLVRELMAKRGYPMGDFERRAADISVHHPSVVTNYRAAQAIAMRDSQGQADTEELRKAVVQYRALFDELLEVADPKHEYPPTGPIAV